MAYYIQSSVDDLVIDIRGGASKPTDGTGLDAFKLWKPYHENQLWTLECITGTAFWIQSSTLKDPDGKPVVIAITGVVDPVPEGANLIVARMDLINYQYQSWIINLNTLSSPNVIQTAFPVGPNASHLVINIKGDKPPASGTALDVLSNDGKPRQLWTFVSV